MSTNAAEMITEDGEVIERPRAIARTVPDGGHVAALESMSDADFTKRLALLKKGQERIRQIQKELLVPGEDYGVVPGVAKPMLFKAGAEKLCKFYSYVPTFRVLRIPGDGTSTPHMTIDVVCFLSPVGWQGEPSGAGAGSCNTTEKKYRTKDPKATTGARCEKASDLDNTILKMAIKRAYVDATLRVTATSGLFSQDLADAQEEQAERAREQDLESIHPLMERLKKAETVEALRVAVKDEMAGEEFKALRRTAVDLLRAESMKLRDALKEREAAATGSESGLLTPEALAAAEKAAAAAPTVEISHSYAEQLDATGDREPGDDEGVS